MAGLNKGYHHVAISDQWRIYTPGLPGWEMIGVITRSTTGVHRETDTAALARSPQGELHAVRGSTAELLTNKRKAEAALRAAQADPIQQEQDATWTSTQ